MVMITGGAYQGKTACAVGNFGISQDEIISGRSCTPEEAMSAKCITDLQELLRIWPLRGCGDTAGDFLL